MANLFQRLLLILLIMKIGNCLLNYKKEVNVIGYFKDNFWKNKKTLQLVVIDLIL